MTGSPYIPLEDHDCEALVRWMTMKGIQFAHIANENKATSRHSAARLGAKRKRMGVSPGVPDYMIIIERRAPGCVPRRHLLFIEMKRERAARPKVSPEQRDWLDRLSQAAGIRTAVCYGFDEAVACIERELAAKP